MLCTCPVGCWVTCLALSLMTVIVNSSAAYKHDPVKWSGLNPLFQQYDNLKLSVNVGDEMDFLCPSTEQVPEYYIIYQVTEEEYENCHVRNLNDPGREMRITKIVMNCNDPRSFRYFRFQFLPMSPLGGNFDFQPGFKYYFLTTSTGDISGINLLENGACREKNMKLTIEVGQRVSPTLQPSQVSGDTQSTTVATSTTRFVTSRTTRRTSSTTSSTTSTSSTSTTSHTTSSTRRTTSSTRTSRLPTTVRTTKSEDQSTTGKPPTSNSNSGGTTSSATSLKLSTLWMCITILLCLLHCKFTNCL